MRMRNWFGCVLLIGFTMILVFPHTLISNKQPQELQPQPQPQPHKKKQSAYGFFNPTDNTTTSHLNKEKVAMLMPTATNTKKKKPHLINVEGLSDLFINLNNSVVVSDFKSLLIWAEMRTLLSSSDALIETAQGIKEAAVAWKDLMSIIHKENTASNFTNTPENKDCPSSVVMTRTSNLTVLELPCGLVEDSSITVVGIPDGSFQIQLLASEIIILDYNVTLPGGNNFTEAVIVQNTWTNEFGWGKPETCPAHGTTNVPTVDGLVLCNEYGGSMSSDFAANVSAHTSASANFPFVEGNLFTATLWVGLEGFHMTVNGRHETSFDYREKLELWMVTGVKMTGSLDMLSALAKGLPVSEDLDMVLDVEHLRAPTIPRKRIVMLVGVFSTGNNFDRRMALRRSWMQYEAVRSGKVAVRFFIGLHNNMQVNIELWREAQAYGDIQFMPFVDYYSLISFKTIAICILGTKILPAKYIMKTDDDAFVRIDEILSSLKGKPSSGLLYGMMSFESEPHRDKNSKWYISTEEWPHASFPPWAHGPGYIITRDIAKFIVRGHQEGDLKPFKLEDVAMGIWIEIFKKSGQEVHYINDERFHNAGCESNYVLAHYQNPRMVLCLWEKLQKENQPICCK